MSTPSHTAASNEDGRRRTRVLVFFLVLGLITLGMGATGFARSLRLGLPPGLISIVPPASPTPTPSESPSPPATPSPTSRSSATPMPAWSPPPSATPLPAGSPTPPPFPPPPPPPVAVGLQQAGSWTATMGNLVPGDTVSRLVTIRNSGSVDLVNYQLAVTSSTSNALTTDSVHGLQLRVERCSTAWIFGGIGSALAAICPGTLTTLVATSPVIGTHSLAAGAFCSSAQASHATPCTLTDTDHLRLTASVPLGAGNSLQGLSNGVTFTWSGAGG